MHHRIAFVLLQTGERLKGVIAGVVEGTLRLVADPMTSAAAGRPPVQAGSGGGCGLKDGSGNTAISAALAAARFVEVFSSRTGAASQGPSGIRML